MASLLIVFAAPTLVQTSALFLVQTWSQGAAQLVGQRIAELCLAKDISDVSFDRGGNVYHGRVKVRHPVLEPLCACLLGLCGCVAHASMTSCAGPLWACWDSQGCAAELDIWFDAAGSGRRSARNRPFLLITVGRCCSARCHSTVAAAHGDAGVHGMQAAGALHQSFGARLMQAACSSQNPCMVCAGWGVLRCVDGQAAGLFALSERASWPCKEFASGQVGCDHESMDPPVQSPMASAASSSAFSFSLVSSALSFRSMSSCAAHRTQLHSA